MSRRVLMHLLLAVVVLALTPLTVMAQEALTETFATEGGALTFNYPAGWVVDGDFNGISGANSQEAFDSTSENPVSGQFQFFILVANPEDLGVEAGASALDAVNAYRDLIMSDTSDPVTFQEPVESTVGDSSFAYVIGVDDEVEALLGILAVPGDRYLVVAGGAFPGEIGTFQPTLLAIAETIVYDAVAAETEAANVPDFTSDFSVELDPTAFAAAVPGTENVIWTQQTELLYDNKTFGTPNGITVGADDTIYVADGSNGIVVLDANGTVLKNIYPSEVLNVADLAVAEDGTFWIADSYNQKVYHVDATGATLSSFGAAGTEPGQFGDSITPNEIEIGPDGNLYLVDTRSDAEGNSTTSVLVFSQDGTFVTSFPITQAGETNYTFNVAIAFAPDGKLYAGDFFGNMRVFDTTGAIIADNFAADTLSANFAAANSLAVDADGNVLVASDNGIIYKFDPTGALLTQTGVDQPSKEDGTYGAFEPGQFYGPQGIDVLSNGDIVVADSNYTFTQIVRLVLK